MKAMRLLCIQILTSAALIGTASAHVQLDYPRGGETFAAGDTITIRWTLQIMHNQIDWDLLFSPDGGVNWQAVASGIDISVLQYRWIVPQVATSQGRIRIVQDNVGMDYTSDCLNFTITVNPTSVRDSEVVPDGLTLHPNFPNPFNPETTIRYETSEAAGVTLTIYNQIGQKVQTLVNAMQPAGTHSITWDGRDAKGRQVASGVYVYFLRSGAFFESRKMLLQR